MNAKPPASRCVIMVIADGFDEAEAIVILSTLRQAGVCAKSVGLTSGLIKGAHGIPVRPDFTLADLEQALDPASIAMVILSAGERYLSSIKTDPRVHRLLRQVVAHQGYAVANALGAGVLKAAIDPQGNTEGEGSRLILRYPMEMSLEVFAQDLVRRLEG